MDSRCSSWAAPGMALPSDLLANVLEHLPRDDTGITAIRQTCR